MIQTKRPIISCLLKAGSSTSILTKLFFIFMFSSFLSFINCTNEQKSENEYYFSFEQIESRDGVRKQIFADLDLDGFEEYIYTDTEYGPVVFDFETPIPQLLCHLYGNLVVPNFKALDLSGDKVPEIFISIKKENKAKVNIIKIIDSLGTIGCEPLLQTEYVSGTDSNNDGKWDGMMGDFQVLDLNEDNQKDIITGIATGIDREPRGIWTFDGKTGKKLWEFPIAGLPCKINCAEVNGDGKDEIIFDTYSPANGVSYGGMDDSHSYLICLNSRGQLQWSNEMGGSFIRNFYIADDFDNDGESEIICTHANGDQASKFTTYQLQILNVNTGEKIRYFPLPTPFRQPFLVDLDRDGKNEILITNLNGCIYVFDSNLNELQKSQLDTYTERCEINQIVDINQDGKQEIIINLERNLLILNEQLEILGNYQTEMRIEESHFFVHPLHGKLISVLQSSIGEIRKNVFLKIHRTSEFSKLMKHTKGEYSLIFLLIVFMLGMAVMLIVLKIVPLIFKRNNSSTSSDTRLKEYRDSLLQALSAFGHERTATASANLSRLNMLFMNPPKNELLLAGHKKRIEESLETYFKFTSKQLNELVDKEKVAEFKIEESESLEDNVKKLEALLLDFRKRGFIQNQVEKMAKEIPVIMESLDINIKSLKAGIECYYSNDIVVLGKEILAAVTPNLKDENITLMNSYIEGDINAKGFIGESDFNTIFEDLISNAITAMKQASFKEISVKIAIGAEKIFVDITDTGCGIEKENINKIFDRTYSTKKEGGGYGLYHAKNTLNKYGGKIVVLQSTIGRGTTMRMEIKRVK